MMTITPRNLPPALERVVRQRAENERTSLNQAVVRLLEGSAGLSSARKKKTLRHDLDSLAGRWPKNEAASFDRKLAGIRQVDRELWK